MPPVDPDRAAEVRSILRAAESIMEILNLQYENAGVPLPTRQYYTAGVPVVDGEQAVLSFTQAFVGPPGDQAATPQTCGGVNSMTLTLGVWRCMPVSGNKAGTIPPSAEQLQEAAQLPFIDAYLLLDIAKDFEVWADGLGPGLGVIATVDAAEPQGGYAGMSLTITLASP
jgi:hypothetical protein